MTAKNMMAFTLVVAFVACVFAVQAEQAPDPRVADLVQSGKLRVALGLGSPVLAMKDPKSGEVQGPALDLARVLATKIGVQLEPVEYPFSPKPVRLEKYDLPTDDDLNSPKHLSYLAYYVYSEVPPDKKPTDTVLDSLKGIPVGVPIEEIKRASDALSSLALALGIGVGA